MVGKRPRADLPNYVEVSSGEEEAMDVQVLADPSPSASRVEAEAERLKRLERFPVEKKDDLMGPGPTPSPELVDRIRAVIHKLREKAREEKQKWVRKILASNRQIIRQQAAKSVRDRVPAPANAFPRVFPAAWPQAPDNNTVNVKLYSSKSDGPLPLSGTRLPFSKGVPSCVSYVPLHRNFRVDDDPVLRFMPYFGDDDTTGCDLSGYEKMPGEEDKSELSDEEGEDFMLMSVLKMFKPIRTTFLAVAEVLTKNVSPVWERYSEIKKRLALRSGEIRPHAVSVKELDNLTGDRIMLSYQDLFCRRCCIYDCHQHGIQQPRPRSLPVEQSSQEEKDKEQKRFCSADCWKRSPTAPQPAPAVDMMSGSVLVSKKSKESASESTKPKASSLFSPLEKALFEKAWVVSGHIPCRVALLLGTKTCRQVYDYSVEVGSHVTIAVKPPAAPAKKRKKGKDKAARNSVQAEIHRKRKAAGALMMVEYVPCDHPGECNESNGCSCILNPKACEKYCGCDKSCKRRETGCHCQKSRCQTRACPCFAAYRECDPDLCKSCGACTPTDESKKGGKQCSNVAILTGRHKRLAIARSGIHGWGAFILEPAEKNDLVYEYTGELISQEEADRRGKIYDKLNSSFLFNLNDEWVVDATRKGNKIKFANHSSTPNCFAKVVFVNGDHHIGIFAKDNIKPGAELSFDYRYTEDNAPTWVGADVLDFKNTVEEDRS